MRKSNIYFVVALMCALTADTSLYNGFIFVAVIMYSVFVFCTIRLIFMDNEHEKQIDEKYTQAQRQISKVYKYVEKTRNEFLSQNPKEEKTNEENE